MYNIILYFNNLQFLQNIKVCLKILQKIIFFQFHRKIKSLCEISLIELSKINIIC